MTICGYNPDVVLHRAALTGFVNGALCSSYVYTEPLLAEHLTLSIAAVVKAWSLLGSPRNGQAALYVFQKTFTVLRGHL